MKRIILVHHTSTLGGGTKSLVDAANMLACSYEVLVCIPKGSSVIKNVMEKKHIRIIEMDEYVPYMLGFSGAPALLSKGGWQSIRSLRHIRKFCKALEGYHPDIVIFNSIVTAVSAVFLNENILKICIDRETLTKKVSLILYRYILDHYVNGVCFLAEYERKKLNLKNVKTLILPDSVPEEDIHLLCNKEAREKEQLPLDDYLVLYMGGSSLIKGPDIILNAANCIDRNCKIIIAGAFNKNVISRRIIIKHIVSPKVFYRLIKLRRAYDIAIKNNNVIFVGSRQDISNLYNSADIVVFPSADVHQPRPCIEAGYYSKPVIISDYNETKEYFINGYNALTFLPGNYTDLSSKIVYAIDRKEEMRIMGDNNRYMSLQYHNYLKICEDFLDFIKIILKDRVNKS